MSLTQPSFRFPRREDVDRANTTRMAGLQGARKVFRALDGGTMEDAQGREKILANFMAPGELKLCVDSQVMLIKNMDDNLVNGSMGRVLGFCEPALYKHVNSDDQIVRAEETYDTSTKEGKRAWERKQRLIEEGKIEENPVVKFQIPGGGSTTMILQRETFKVELPSGEVQVSRSQVRLVWLRRVGMWDVEWG